MNRADTIVMNVESLSLDPSTRTPIVVLRDEEGKLALPLWIGILEATAIATELDNIEAARPMTHDLLCKAFEELQASVEAVEVSDLKENTFYATIHLQVGGRDIQLDSRPSDALALAIRAKCPILVAKKVLEQSSVLNQGGISNSPSKDLSEVKPERWSDILERMTPDDFKYKM